MAWAKDADLGTNTAVSGTSIVLTTTAAAAAGSLIVVCAGHWNADPPYSLSGGGLTWTEDVVYAPATSRIIHVFSAYASAGLASGSSLTFTGQGATINGLCIGATSFTGGGSTGKAQTGTQDNAASSVTWNAANITTTGSSDLVVGAAYTSTRTTTSTPGGSWVEMLEIGNSDGETLTAVYQINVAAGSYQPTGTWAATSVTAGATSSYEQDAASWPPARQQLAHDTDTRFPATENTADTTTGDRTFNHAGAAGAKGAVVVLCGNATAASVTGVLYGGVTMTLSASATDTTEVGRVDVYTLTTGVPTGTQTVTLQGCTATAKFCTCSTVTAEGTVIVDTTAATNTTTSTNPQVSLALTQTAISYGAVHSGVADITTGTALTGCTLQHYRDYGALGARTLRRTTPETGTVALGVTLGSDDWCAAAAALAEVVLPDVVMAPVFPT